MRAVDTGAASRSTQDMVQRHIFNEKRTERRAEELRRLQATCIPELVAMLDKARDNDEEVEGLHLSCPGCGLRTILKMEEPYAYG